LKQNGEIIYTLNNHISFCRNLGWLLDNCNFPTYLIHDASSQTARSPKKSSTFSTTFWMR